MIIALTLTLSITLAVVPSIVIRYFIFSKVITKIQIHKLLKYYSIWFIIQNIVLFFLILNTNGNLLPIYYKICNILIGVCYFFINCFIIRGMFYKHVFVMGMQGCFSLVLHSLSSMILSNFSNPFIQDRPFIMHSFIYILLFILTAVPLWQLLKNSLVLKLSNQHDYYWNIIWMIPFLLFFSNMVLVLDNTWIHTWQQLAVRLLSGYAIFIIWKCINLDFEELTENYTLKTENEFLQMQMDTIKNQAETITENDKKISIIRHDLRHHVQMLSSLINKGDLSAASSLLNHLNDELESTKPIIFCKNSIINASLLVYISKARKEHIEIISEIDIPENIPWNSNDIAILFANSLENAIHASRMQPLGQRIIDITTRYSDRKLAINIKNRFDDEIAFNDQGLPFALEENHGLGMVSIQAITTKYKGQIACSHEQGWYSLSLLFYELLIDKV